MANKIRWRSNAPPAPSWRTIIAAGCGSFLTIGTVAWLQDALAVNLLVASVGASCLIVFALPESPLAQPRNVVCGHLLSAAVGWGVAHTLGVNIGSMALAVAGAVMLMLLSRTPHPPAAANPLIVMMAGGGTALFWRPFVCGAVVLVVVACLVHRLNRQSYPNYWW